MTVRYASPPNQEQQQAKANTAISYFKETYEQPAVIADTLNTFVNPATNRICVPNEVLEATLRAPRITLIACGTAYYACMVAKYWFETIARTPCEVDVASIQIPRSPLPSDGLASLCPNWRNTRHSKHCVTANGNARCAFVDRQPQLKVPLNENHIYAFTQGLKLRSFNQSIYNPTHNTGLSRPFIGVRQRCHFRKLKSWPCMNSAPCPKLPLGPF